MTHVCHILTTFQQRASITRRTSAILRECVAQGFQTSLLIGEDNDVPHIDGVETIVIPNLYKHLSLINDFQVLRSLKKVLVRLQPDIVHTHQAKAGILGRLVAGNMICRPRILHTVHGPTFPAHLPAGKRVAYRWFERWAGKHTDCFVFIGDEIKQEYIDGGVCDEASTVIIRTGKPDSLIKRVILNGDEREQLRRQLCGGQSPRYLITYVARIVPIKQHEHTIEVLKRLRVQGLDAHLSFVGKALVDKERNYETRLRQLVDAEGLTDYVHFSGFYDNVYDVIEASDLLLLTSRYEGLPNIVIESMLLGTPLLAYDVAGLRELFCGQSEQFVLSQGDVDGLATKAANILQLENRGGIYDAGNVARLRNEHALGTMLARKVQLYKGLG